MLRACVRLAARVPAVHTDIILFRKSCITVFFLICCSIFCLICALVLLFTDLQAKISLQRHVINIFGFCHVLPLIVFEVPCFKKVITTQI